MTERLKGKVEEFETKHGKTKLCLAIGRCETTLYRWKKTGVPSRKEAFHLAKVVGFDDEVALAVAAEECPSDGPRTKAG